MRQKTNTSMICSSFNYESSHRAHKNMLERNHQVFMSLGYKSDKKIYYTKCGGKLIRVPDEKVKSFRECNIPLIEL